MRRVLTLHVPFQFLYFVGEGLEFTLHDIPDYGRIHMRVPMNENVSESNHLAIVRDILNTNRIRFSQLADRFADDFELPLDCRPE